MTLLKGDNSVKSTQKTGMAQRPSGSLTVSDGWRFGIGLCLAFIFGAPFILFIAGAGLWVLLSLFGEIIGGLL
ncbi:hypothetical protein LCGC14_1136770 [marine sediment metagenome]|uniref:Uncharacterized protein n=1 Tax=marine sediment metagenome TaxID=412755 RepID=A0A0F9M4C0_9ZZZZ